MTDEASPTDEATPTDETTSPGESAPSDVFEAVAHPDRLSILRVLLDVQRSADERRVGFTDLRDRAGIDDTGRFNYHLDRLRDAYVTGTDEGYRLSSFGFRVLAPMAAGRYDPDRSPDSIDAPGECYQCGSDLEIRYRENTWQVVCTDGHTVNYGLVGYPAIAADRTPEEAVAALGHLNAQALELGVAGTCPTCHGRLDGRIVSADEVDAVDVRADGPGGHVYRAPCERCGNQFMTSVGGCVATHPRVVRFLADRGVDVRRAAPWTLPFRHPGAETVVSEDPLRLRVAVGEGVGDDGASLPVVVDREGAVVAVEREPA